MDVASCLIVSSQYSHCNRIGSYLRIDEDVALLDQEADDLEVSLGGGQVQRGASVVVAIIQVHLHQTGSARDAGHIWPASDQSVFGRQTNGAVGRGVSEISAARWH